MALDKRAGVGIVLMLPGILVAGCTIGPAAIRVSQAKYNDAIQYTSNEQLLLNLVRLRYRDVPYFLQVSSVSTQFEIDQSLDAAGTLAENVGPAPINPDLLTVGGRLGYSERPTVTIVPLQGSEFVKKMLSTYDVELIALLHSSGWAIDRLLVLTVASMNHLANAVNASSPTPDDAPAYRPFARLAFLLRQLQKRGELVIGYDVRTMNVGDPLPAAAVGAQHALAAARDGYEFARSGEEGGYVLRATRRVMQLGVVESAADSPEWREVCELLGLEGPRARYDVVPGQTELSDAGLQRYGAIYVQTRSLLGTLFLVSHAIAVPDDHREKGLVTITRDSQGQVVDWRDVISRLLTVRSRLLKPDDAAVTVQYRGHWFSIDDADRNSKATFILLTQLLSLQSGEAEARAPVLTLPVGR